MIKKACLTRTDFQEQNALLARPLPFFDDTGVLAQSLDVGGRVLSNRLVCQAMEGCDGNHDGTPGELTARRYDRLARGGAGLIWFEATAVLPEARANPRQLWITEDNLDAFRAQVEAIREAAMKSCGRTPVIIMQATHSGRYSRPEGVPAPLIAYNSPILEKNAPIPAGRIVSDEYLDRTGEALVNAARLAERAGFDGVDIKCCHRYLNCELLSAFERGGRYGGSLENRTRLLCESVSGAMQVCRRDFIVTTRLNAYDGFPYPYGFGVRPEGLEFDPAEPVLLLKRLAEAGVRLVDITMGNPYFNPHVNRPFASGSYEPPEAPIDGVARMLEGTALLKKAVPELKFICSALTYLGTASPNVAAAFISGGGFDLAGYGRMILAYPEFANDIVKTGGLDRGKCCLTCSKCTEIMRAGGTPGCVVRDGGVYLPIYKKYCAKGM